MSQFQDPNTADLSFEDEEVFIESSGTAEVILYLLPRWHVLVLFDLFLFL